MKRKTVLIVVAVLAYITLGFFAAEYLAGGAYFLINKTMPTDITTDTWLRYWSAYADDPVQHKHLQLSAVVAGILVYVGPLFVLAAARGKTRSLHGDARWATSGEIRKAGLL